MTCGVLLLRCHIYAVLVGLFFLCCESSSHQNHIVFSRWKRQTCGENMFKCGSGECISSDLVCDGEKNCKDRSDETNETCINNVIPILASYLNPSLISYIDKCPSDEFRCDSGKCISRTKRCNNRKDCFDGSDEKECENSCRPGEFQCTSSTCLASHHLCDGTKDCEDGSDETVQHCHNMRCADDQFRCKYGACIRRSALCDSKSDCVDGSDENVEKCKTPPQVTTDCVLPLQPENGEYHLGGCDPPTCHVTPETKLGNFAILNYTCHSGYKLTVPSVVWCSNAVWSSDFPTCDRALCPALMDQTRNFECKFLDSNVNCSEPMKPGAKANVKCETYYITSPELSNYQITCTENGNWSNVIHPCTSECGFPNPNGLPFISNGKETKLAEFPWHVGIYQIIEETLKQSCGGNLIGSKVVITAAHCFWNEDEGKPSNTDSYRVTAGKYYRDWKMKTRYFQEAEIERVEIMTNFKGRRGLYAYDIAVVILKTNFVMNEAVRPICLDLEQKFSEDFGPGKIGVIVGWGYTENKTQSEVLHAITLPYEERDICIEKTKETFAPFLQIHDKFCVGTTIGKSVCPGDSGGGFATKFKGSERYYLMGIVSAGVAPEGSDTCDIFQYSSFTKVPVHYSFLRKHIIL